MKTKIPISFFIIFVLTASAFSKKNSHFNGSVTIGKIPIVITKENFLKVSTAYRNKPSRKIVRVVALVNSQFNSRILSTYGWKYRSNITNDIIEIEGPEGTAQYLTALDGILYVKMPSKVFPSMDSARKLSFIDEIHSTARSSLPKSYKGEGVLVGAMENEFDTRHPAFLDSIGNSRFVAIWDQSDSSGPISKYGFGTIKNRAQIQVDSGFALHAGEMHGTWITGIAAGSEVGANPYYGVAPKASLIGVKYSSDDNDLINGIKWIFSVADSLNLPCVINMSIGLQAGPHDGTSLIDRAIDNMSGNGKIIVGAAGNDGNNKTHLRFVLNRNESKSTWISPFQINNPGSMKSVCGIDMWGKQGVYFTSTFFIIDTSTMVYHELQPSISTSANKQFADTLFLTDSVSGKNDTVYFYALAERRNALNNKVHVEVTAVGSNPNMFLGVKVTNTNTTIDTIHTWNIYKKSFESLGMSGYSGGDTTMSINEIGGTSKRNITVGSYVSKLNQPLWNGAAAGVEEYIYDLNLFSGRGPTVDGRVKPDITAPGCIIVSSLSRNGSDECVVLWPDTMNKSGRYSYSQGTSFAAPIVTGIVALMLQVKPTLSPEEAKQVIQQTSYTDAFTGNILTPNNNWGAGKINAIGAIQTLLGVTAKSVLKSLNVNEISVSYLRNAIRVSGNMLNNQLFEVFWYSIDGKLIKKQLAGLNNVISFPKETGCQVFILKLKIQNTTKSIIVKKL
jgi:subtilisin family serine protease